MTFNSSIFNIIHCALSVLTRTLSTSLNRLNPITVHYMNDSELMDGLMNYFSILSA